MRGPGAGELGERAGELGERDGELGEVEKISGTTSRKKRKTTPLSNQKQDRGEMVSRH